MVPGTGGGDGVSHIKVIQTHYAGHHFRSRLEARWAVFFDHLGIRWQYETEGFDLVGRLSFTSYRYLPDFWLPDHEIWVEVKGKFNDSDLLKTIDCIATLSCNGGAGRHDSGGNDAVVLGPIPRGNKYAPVALCMNKGLLQAGPWKGQKNCLHDHGAAAQENVAGDYGGDLADVISGVGEMEVEEVRDLLTYGYCPRETPRGWDAALNAARTARFEHGATPETAKPYSNSRMPTECQNDRCVSGRLYDLHPRPGFRFCPDPAHHRSEVT